MQRPRTGIFGLTGCAGDQLVVLNCEDQLLTILTILDMRDFLMASQANDTECELDIALVEGSVSSREDEARLKGIRSRSRVLIAIGTCAVWGGIQAMDRDHDRSQLLNTVYGPYGRAFDTLPARPVRSVVSVDYSIPGCPIEKDEFLRAMSNILNGDPPLPITTPVCVECKFRENNCLLQENGAMCLGPVTAGGCNARCPSMNTPCIGCRGPSPDANLASATQLYRSKGFSTTDIANRLRTFAPLLASPDNDELNWDTPLVARGEEA